MRPARLRAPANGERGGDRRGDRGQVSVEFLGILPLILLVLIFLWECVLAGYTYTQAGHAADRGAHMGATAAEGTREAACRNGARSSLGASWQDSAGIRCGDAYGNGNGLYEAEVELEVPVLFPGLASFPVPIRGRAAVAKEG
ncbi:pilus assembly protein [Streptomyces rectiverticillatus]|nr:TadE/TadG family type IV pilus assembly protein [Streptomyces rectiverticillatus]QLE76233.1 pilus assembly protein [Streptomyces rectiverticillatus]